MTLADWGVLLVILGAVVLVGGLVLRMSLGSKEVENSIEQATERLRTARSVGEADDAWNMLAPAREYAMTHIEAGRIHRVERIYYIVKYHLTVFPNTDVNWNQVTNVFK